MGIGTGGAIALAAGVSATAGLAGSAMSASAAGSAAKTQAAAQLQAANLQNAQYQQTYGNLQPYNLSGQGNLPNYQSYYNTTNQALNGASQAALAQAPNGNSIAQAVTNSPAYQFNLAQGLQATQDSAAARGLGVSGAAWKGATNYATGLANTYYQNAFNNQQQIYGDYQNNYANALNTQNATFQQLGAPVSLGENAAAMSGNIGQQAAAAQGGYVAGAGQSQAAGITGTANALNNGLQQVGNSGLNYLAYQNAFGGSNAAGSIPGGGTGMVDGGQGGGALYGNAN